MRKIAIVPNTTKDVDYQGTARVVALLRECGVQPVMQDIHASSGLDVLYLDFDGLTKADMVIVLGGDGTMLSAARDFFETDLPLLGINHGHLGFLTEVEKNDRQSLKEILNGDCFISRHMTLCANVNGNTYRALNEATIHRGLSSSILNITVTVAGDEASAFVADGLIVATPTGSTAYSLSAGGPIVDPCMRALMITPICPHNLHARSILVPANKAVEVHVRNPERHQAMLVLDGQVEVPLTEGQSPVFTCDGDVRLVRKNGTSFYQKLRQKLYEPIDR